MPHKGNKGLKKTVETVVSSGFEVPESVSLAQDSPVSIGPPLVSPFVSPMLQTHPAFLTSPPPNNEIQKLWKQVRELLCNAFTKYDEQHELVVDQFIRLQEQFLVKATSGSEAIAKLRKNEENLRGSIGPCGSRWKR
jgi:hypothetical protein